MSPDLRQGDTIAIIPNPKDNLNREVPNHMFKIKTF